MSLSKLWRLRKEWDKQKFLLPAEGGLWPSRKKRREGRGGEGGRRGESNRGSVMPNIWRQATWRKYE